MLAKRLAAARGGTAWRAEPLPRKIEYARRAGVHLSTSPTDHEVDAVLTQMLDPGDRLPGHWLATGGKRSDAISLLKTPSGACTGFLISPWLVMTSNHALTARAEAESTQAVFRHRRDGRGRTIRARTLGLDPARFFLADDRLGVAVDAVLGPDHGPGPGQLFGALALDSGPGRVLPGQPLNVLQHADDSALELSVRDNVVISLSATHLVYAATAPKASGAPIFNDRWELVGLHQRSLRATNAEGEEVDLFGAPVGNDSALGRTGGRWIANLGVRVSAVAGWLSTVSPSLAPPQRALMAQVLATTGGDR